jgi:ribosome-associated translation inhibitor RaiA
VKLRKDEPVIVEELDDDMYLAISRAADRVKQVIGRHHDRKLSKLHGKA